MAQSGGCLQEALETAADCGLRLTHQIEDLAWPGTQKKKKTGRRKEVDGKILRKTE